MAPAVGAGSRVVGAKAALTPAAECASLIADPTEQDSHTASVDVVSTRPWADVLLEIQ
jgi:hypothetical protein